MGSYLNKTPTPITVPTVTGIMMLSKIISGGCDINYSRFVTVTNEPKQHFLFASRHTNSAHCRKTTNQKKEQCFWYRH